MHTQPAWYATKAGDENMVLCETTDNAVAGTACYELDWVPRNALAGRVVVLCTSEGQLEAEMEYFLHRKAWQANTVAVTVEIATVII